MSLTGGQGKSTFKLNPNAKPFEIKDEVKPDTAPVNPGVKEATAPSNESKSDATFIFKENFLAAAKKKFDEKNYVGAIEEYKAALKVLEKIDHNVFNEAQRLQYFSLTKKIMLKIAWNHMFRYVREPNPNIKTVILYNALGYLENIRTMSKSKHKNNWLTPPERLRFHLAYAWYFNEMAPLNGGIDSAKKLSNAREHWLKAIEIEFKYKNTKYKGEIFPRIFKHFKEICPTFVDSPSMGQSGQEIHFGGFNTYVNFPPNLGKNRQAFNMARHMGREERVRNPMRLKAIKQLDEMLEKTGRTPTTILDAKHLPAPVPRGTRVPDVLYAAPVSQPLSKVPDNYTINIDYGDRVRTQNQSAPAAMSHIALPQPNF